MKRPWLVYGLAFIGGLVVFFLFISFLLSVVVVLKERNFGKPQIGVLKIKGVIVDAEEYLMSLRKLARNRNVKAIVVRINSPGGSVGAAQEIYEELKKIRKIKPVIVSMGSVAASGGYYVALGGKEIFALPGTITGSIGVILQIPNLQKLLKKLGIETETIKSGAYKDTGSFYRPLTSKERKYLKKKVEIIHQQFMKTISKERKISLEKVKTIADGRIFTGEEALKLGLIDKIGNFWDAVDEAKRLAGVKEAKLVFMPEKKSFISKLFEEKSLNKIENLFFNPLYLATE
jgi:protease-4